MQAYDVANHLSEATGLGTDVDTSPNAYGTYYVRFMSADGSPAGIFELFRIGIRLQVGRWVVLNSSRIGNGVSDDLRSNLQGIIDMYQDED